MGYAGMCLIFFVIIAGLCMKICSLKKAARQIKILFEQKLKEDTNTPIGITGRDRDMCALADCINRQLKILRKEHLRYVQGDRELKMAVTNLAHDLRTPLTAVCGYLELMRKEEMSRTMVEYLSIVEERTGKMKDLTEELFRYSVVVSGEMPLQQEKICVNQALEDCIMGYYAALSKRKILPKINLTPNRIIRELDREALERVFANLLNNALKYSDGDLEITLTDEGEIIFSNTAKNLNSVETEKLFERFYTVETARNSTGLGLSIARELVKRMQGSITSKYRRDVLSIHIVFPKRQA